MRVKRPALAVVAVVFGLAVAGSPALAAPQGLWVQPAADLSVAGEEAGLPQIATATDGTTTAIWTRSDGNNYIIQAATRPPGGSFAAPVDLSVTGENAFEPGIATAPDGTATAVWRRYNGSNWIIQAATRPPAGSFAAPVDLSAVGQDADYPQITTGPDGTATAVWYRSNGSNNIIQAATRPPGGSFAAPVNLSVAGQDAGVARISTGSDGTTTAVWTRFDGSNDIIQAATRPPGGSFAAPVDLSVTGWDAGGSQITTAADGTSTVVWSRWSGSNQMIQAATRPPGGSFAAPVDLSVTGENAFEPGIATAPDGTATAVWRRSNGSNDIIQAATRPPGGSFAAPVNLSVTGQDAGAPQITTAPDGTATAIWTRWDGSNLIAQAATRPPGGSFAAPINLSATGRSVVKPQITAAPDGTATAIWNRYNGSNWIIQSISTAQPSPLLSASKTGSGSGTVTSAPAGINCGADCSESYLSYTKVTLSASPGPGSTFTGWSGAGCSGTGTCEVTVTSDQTATAVFAGPSEPWVQPPADLSASGQNAFAAQITTAPDGTATAVWSRSDGSNYIIQAATRPPGGSFAAPVDLSVAGQDAGAPQITTAPDGTATAIWTRSNGSNNIVQAATRPPGGSFAAPVDLSVVGQDASGPHVTTAPDGTATAVWRRYNGSNEIVQAATRPPGGSFGPPVNLSATGMDPYSQQVTTAPDGTTTAIWQIFDGSDFIIQASTRPPGGSFAAPADLSAPSQNADDPQITTAPDGTTTAVWFRFDGSNNIIQASTRPPGGSFGSPVDLSVAGQSTSSPQIVAAPDGTTTVVWEDDNGSNFIVQAATRPPGGSFAAPVDLSATGQDASSPQIAAAPDGTVTAVWFRYNGSSQIVQAAIRPPGGSFGVPVDLSDQGGNDAVYPQVTTAPDGTATAIWTHYNGSYNIIQSISTAQPSPLLSVSKTGSGSGTVTSTPAGINCGADCSENYLSYTKVTLTATPGSGSMFKSWGGACKGASGNTCQVTVLDDATATANFGKPKLKVTKAKPAKPKVKPGKTVKLKVTAKNTGDGTAKNAKLCVNLNKSVKKALKPKGRTCQKMGSIGAGKTKTKAFKLKATGKAKKGKGYKVTFKLTANEAKTVTKSVKVKVK